MDVISSNVSMPSSGLNPNAPMFVPASYKAVEDFSDEWWSLVHSSPWFQDYWLQYRFQDPQNDPLFSEIDDYAPLFSEFDDVALDSLFHSNEEDEKEREYNKDMITLGALKWRKMHDLAGTPRFAEKAPKIVNKKMIPRPIQQPR